MRQLVHIFLGIALLAVALALGMESASYIIFYVFVLYTSFLYATSIGLMPLLKVFIRKEEVAPGAGALFYLASALFLASYPGMRMDVFAAALLALSLGDGFSTLVGSYFGRKHLLNGKSLEGSLGGFLALFLAYVALGFPLMPSLALSLAFVLVELLSSLDDNITIPLVVAGVAMLLL